MIFHSPCTRCHPRKLYGTVQLCICACRIFILNYSFSLSEITQWICKYCWSLDVKSLSRLLERLVWNMGWDWNKEPEAVVLRKKQPLGWDKLYLLSDKQRQDQNPACCGHGGPVILCQWHAGEKTHQSCSFTPAEWENREGKWRKKKHSKDAKAAMNFGGKQSRLCCTRKKKRNFKMHLEAVGFYSIDER